MKTKTALDVLIEGIKAAGGDGLVCIGRWETCQCSIAELVKCIVPGVDAQGLATMVGRNCQIAKSGVPIEFEEGTEGARNPSDLEDELLSLKDEKECLEEHVYKLEKKNECLLDRLEVATELLSEIESIFGDFNSNSGWGEK